MTTSESETEIAEREREFKESEMNVIKSQSVKKHMNAAKENRWGRWRRRRVKDKEKKKKKEQARSEKSRQDKRDRIENIKSIKRAKRREAYSYKEFSGSGSVWI